MLAADLRPKRIVTDLLSLATPRRLDANASCERTFWQLNGKIKALLVKLGRLSLLDAVAGKVMVEFLIPTPFPETPLWDRVVKEGRLLHTDWENFDGLHSVYRPMNFTPEDLRGVCEWALDRILFHPPLYI